DEQRTVDPVTARVDLCCKCIPAVTGACCLPDDTCAVTTAADCATRQGQYLGDNTVCLGVEACCLPSGACAQIDAACCTARGGMPQGAGSDCLSVDCPLPACQPNAAGTACEQVVCPANTGCFGECINGSYCDNDVCCLDPAACQCYAKNTKESIKRCGDCFGSCVMGSYCDDPTNPDCCIVPGACACYLPSHDVSIQLCGDCFGECIGGSYCDHPNPSCAVVPGAPACYDATSPISQKFCQDPTTPPDECQASCVNFDPLTGITTVTECNCVGVDSCHVELPTAAGGVTAMAAAAGGPCVVPEARTCAVTGESCTVDANCPVMPGNTCTGAPTGTVMMPPIGCEYLSPDEFHEILAGLPADTQLELAPIHKDFICNRGDGFPGCPPPGVCEETGGTLGGNVDCFDSTLQLTISGNPGGALAGFNRVLSVPVLTRVDTGPRTAGDAVQDFDTEMVQLQGELFGDPDFCTLRITGGTAMGLPSPGHTTLTRLPGGDFQVDSFFDVFYRIEYVGCPGSALEGFSGENGGIIKMQTGSAPSCVGQCPPGERCVEERTVLPDGTFDLCCRCECPQADPPLPEAKVTEKNRFISMVPQNPGRQTALQVTLVSLPGAFSVWNGQQLWVTNPRPITEQAGTPGAQPPPTFTGANGQCTPDCRDWGAVGLIDVFGEWVVPGATYEVRAVDCACNMTDPANFSAPLVLKTSRFGDIVGPFDTQTRQWTQPEGIITILQDAIAALDKFKNRPTAPRKARVELEPNCLDMVVNITEVVRILDAFRGRPYPDVPKNPALRACESVCP
ncbi:MAG: hypothetical protein ACE5EX_08430, partial [Phycisphaerae bacterium]